MEFEDLFDELGFAGQYEHSIDAKGRMIIPAKFRKDLGSQFVLTKGMDGCLFAMSVEEFSKLMKTLKAFPLNSADARDYTRHFMANAFKCELDKQGRILVDPKLRKAANLEKEVVIVGVINRVEIWDKATWEEKEAGLDLAAIEQHFAEHDTNIVF